MTIKYEVLYSKARFSRDGADVVHSYMKHPGFNSVDPGIEVRLERLATLIGLISDKLNLNLLEILDNSFLSEEFVVKTDES